MCNRSQDLAIDFDTSIDIRSFHSLDTDSIFLNIFHTAARVLVLGIALSAVPAAAWGDYAHRLISQKADAQLTARAKLKIEQLLRSEAFLATPLCRLQSLEDASVWPDCIRSHYRQRFSHTAPWHYINVPVCGAFALPECEDGQCVTAALRQQISKLRDPAATQADRLMALAWVAHLVGDIHQPLHVGDNGDRGGNQIKVNFGDRRYKYGQNLHSVWDRDMPEIVLGNGVSSIPYSKAEQGDANPSSSRIDQWARQSWQLSRTVVYPRLPQGFACGQPVDNQDLGDAYMAAAAPGIRKQVGDASARLASILNAALP